MGWEERIVTGGKIKQSNAKGMYLMTQEKLYTELKRSLAVNDFSDEQRIIRKKSEICKQNKAGMSWMLQQKGGAEQ